MGSVFSPYYAAARRRGHTDPREHVAVNVALYGPGGRRWAMTERGAAQLRQSRASLQVGGSSLRWEGDVLEIALDEVAVPLPRRVRGRLRIEPSLPALAPLSLDEGGRHRWQPVAPRARIEVVLDAPDLRWSGEAYVDANAGDEPLEAAFLDWQWSRTFLPDGDCLLRYDVRRREGGVLRLNVLAGRDGGDRLDVGDPPRPIASTRWGIARAAHDGARLVETLEDGPFYARSLLSTPWCGESLPTMHESVSLARFRQRWVQALLPFRMPRRAGRGGAD